MWPKKNLTSRNNSVASDIFTRNWYSTKLIGKKFREKFSAASPSPGSHEPNRVSVFQSVEFSHSACVRVWWLVVRVPSTSTSSVCVWSACLESIVLQLLAMIDSWSHTTHAARCPQRGRRCLQWLTSRRPSADHYKQQPHHSSHDHRLHELPTNCVQIGLSVRWQERRLSIGRTGSRIPPRTSRRQVIIDHSRPGRRHAMHARCSHDRRTDAIKPAQADSRLLVDGARKTVFIRRTWEWSKKTSTPWKLDWDVYVDR